MYEHGLITPVVALVIWTLVMWVWMYATRIPAMQKAGISDIKDLARQVPSLQVQSNTSPLAMSYRVRRVGNLGNIPTFEPAVGVFQDGAFRNRPVFSAGDMFDVDRIEVLRGPQSTLYGKNTTAGVVAVYTRKPSEEFTGNAEFTAGNFDGASDAGMYRFVGGVSGPLADTLSASLGLSYSTNDHVSESALSVSDEDANDLERGSVRGQLQWQPSDTLSVRLIGGAMFFLGMLIMAWNTWKTVSPGTAPVTNAQAQPA